MVIQIESLGDQIDLILSTRIFHVVTDSENEMKTLRNRIIIPANNRFEFLIYTYIFEKFYI